jgi:hypothetical protein
MKYPPGGFQPSQITDQGLPSAFVLPSVKKLAIVKYPVKSDA